MFVQQSHDFDSRVGINTCIARVNVELEQRTNIIDSWFADCCVDRSLAAVVDRVLVDAVERTHQLARVCTVRVWCEMQRCITIMAQKQKIWSEETK